MLFFVFLLWLLPTMIIFALTACAFIWLAIAAAAVGAALLLCALLSREITGSHEGSYTPEPAALPEYTSADVDSIIKEFRSR